MSPLLPLPSLLCSSTMGAGMSSLMHLVNLQHLDDGQRTTEVHQFNTHGDTWIRAVYTNEGSTLASVLAMYDEWMKDEDDKIIGLDLEYDFAKNKIAFIQLAVREHVLVFHHIRYKDNISSLKDFIWGKNYTFVGVDIRSDNRLYKEWLPIPPGKHIDIQDLFRLDGCPRTGMAAMAIKLIHPKYAGMKEKCVTDYEKHQGHRFWEYKLLSDMNLEYAATDGYVTYELGRILTLLIRGWQHLGTICQVAPTMDMWLVLHRRWESVGSTIRTDQV